MQLCRPDPLGARQFPGRVAISVLAIALGVALGFAVQIINASAVGEMAQAARVLSGDADLTLRGAREGFDESLYPLVARLPAVAAISPALEVEARVAGRDEALTIVGVDLFRAGQLQPGLLAEGVDAFDLLREDTVLLSPAAMAWLGIGRGDLLRVQVGLALRSLRVAGALAGEAAHGRRGLMDIGAAQWVFDRPGRISRLDLRLVPGTDVDAFAAALRLPPGIATERPQAAGAASARMTRAYRVNLDVLALVALFTGGLLVFSTQALSVARRRAQIALLRVTGFTRRQILLLMLWEGLILGVGGAILGLLGGAGIAAVGLRVFGGDLGAGFFRGTIPALQVSATTALTFGGLGVVAALLGSLGPALEAARAAPALALKSGDDARAFGALGAAWPGASLLAVGAVLTQLPPLGGLPIAGYFAIAAMLLGTILLLPRFTAILLANLPSPPGSLTALVLTRLRAYPAQAAVSLAAIVAAVSLMVSMAIMVASFRDSLATWLEAILPADLYLRSAVAGDSGFIGPDDQTRIRAGKGIARVEFLRWQQLLIDPAQPRVTLLARDGVAVDPERRLMLIGDVVRSRDATPDVWISEPAAAILDLAPGAMLDLPLGGAAKRFHVAGVWRDYARQNGAVLIDRSVYAAATGDTRANDAGLWLAPDADRAAVKAALRAIAGAGIELAEPGDIRALSLRIFDRTFAVTYALEVVAVLIGLVGLSSAIGGQVLARRREFGVLRHLGVTRRQIGTMLALEGLAVSAVGLTVGSALGLVMSLVLIHVVNRQSFHLGMELHIPVLPLASFALAMLALGTLTAAIGGRRAMTGDVVRAVREDW